MKSLVGCGFDSRPVHPGAWPGGSWLPWRAAPFLLCCCFCLRTENRACETRIFDDRGGVGWGGVGWGKMLPSCYATEIFSRLSYIFDATLVRSSLDFHRSLMLRWGGVGWGGARCYRHVNICTFLMLRY